MLGGAGFLPSTVWLVAIYYSQNSLLFTATKKSSWIEVDENIMNPYQPKRDTFLGSVPCQISSQFPVEWMSGSLFKDGIPSRELNRSSKNGNLKMSFPFPKVGHVNSLEGILSFFLKDTLDIISHIWKGFLPSNSHFRPPTERRRRSEENEIIKWQPPGRLGATEKEVVSIPHTIHVWYIYLHLVDFDGKCR